MTYFATEQQWLSDPESYQPGDYLVVLPVNFTGTEGVFPYRIATGKTVPRLLRIAGNSFFQVTTSTGGTVTVTNPFGLEATQQDVLTQLNKFQFDPITGDLKVTGGGSGGGTVDQGAAGVDPWPVDTGLSQGLTDAQLRATPVPVSGPLTDTQLRASPVPVSATSLPIPTGAATSALQVTGNTSLSSIDSKTPSLGQQNSAGSVPVVMASDQSTIPVSIAASVTVNQGNPGLFGSPWYVDGSGVTQPVSATSLPLPTGAATAALQTQPGVDIGDVTVNNASGASAVNIQDGGNSITVDNSGTFATQVTSITPPTLTKGTQGTTGFSVQALKDSGRTMVTYYTDGSQTAGATGTETAITLTASSGTSATTTGVSFVIPSGKTFRIMQMMLETRGNNTATAQTTRWNFRLNTAGAVTTASTPVVMSVRTSNGATANQVDRQILTFTDGLEFYGDGTMEWGLTANSSYTTNAPNLWVMISGYQY